MEHAQQIKKLRDNISRVYRGNREVVELCLVALMARGHLLLEDVPGVGKTTLASVIAKSINCQFQRIQFTSDLLPSDILGVTIYNQDTHEFEFKPGPLFANVVLADEINRTTPKTQSALLEAMNTARVSMDRKVYPLPSPFMVLATQNPLEFHGTFPLPKSQMDRFLMRIHLGYPPRDEEIRILKEQRMAMVEADVEHVLAGEEVSSLQEATADVKIEDDLLDYMTRIAEATRHSGMFELGCSTRGLLALRRASQAHAFVEGRRFVIPDDIKRIAVPVLAHRIQIARTFERGGMAHHEDEDAVRRILEEVEVPL
ncbi:MoxR family ATPase [Candidatus Poribacteria bacterium]|nr:MoxR family ATPase [Candidatus Poribacteria bacterium]